MKLVQLTDITDRRRPAWFNPLQVRRVNPRQSGEGCVLWTDDDKAWQVAESSTLVVALINFELAVDNTEKRVAADHLREVRSREEADSYKQ